MVVINRCGRYRSQDQFFFYNDKGLYVGVANYQDNETLLARLSSRDRFIRRDGVSPIDSSGEGLYGYWFSVNLGGTLQDGTVIPERQFSNQWDGAWDGAWQKRTLAGRQNVYPGL